MDIAYGHLVNSDDDHYIELGEKGNHAFADVGRYIHGSFINFKALTLTQPPLQCWEHVGGLLPHT